MIKTCSIILLALLFLSACSGDGEDKAERAKKTKETIALLNKVKIGNTPIPDETIKKSVEYVNQLAKLGEEQASKWEKSARFPKSIMPYQGKNKEFRTAYKAIMEKCKQDITCKKVKGCMGLGHFTIMGVTNLSLNLMISRKITPPAGSEDIKIYRVNYKGADTLALLKAFTGTQYEKRGKAWLLINL